MRTRSLLLLALAGCARADAGPTTDHFVLRGGTVPGLGAVDVEVRDGRIAAVGEAAPGAELLDVEGAFVVPAWIDSHVHLAYLPQADAMADGGIAAAVDLAAPIETLASPPAALRVLGAGPMITAVGGYPTQSWGRGGYGLECADAAAAEAAVATVHEAGAALVKLPITGEAVLDEPALRAAVEAAHARGLKVVAHALSDEEAALAAAVGVDALAHTPTEALSDATVAAWSDRAVISTLRAFGGSPTAVDNLRRLREAGTTVLYGTDFGNTRTPGIDADEVALLGEAGLDGGAILASATSAPAAFWGLDADLGAVEVGRAASLLVVDQDPTTSPEAVTSPRLVLLDGVTRQAGR